MNTSKPAADAHDAIVVTGAGENNLRNVSLEIPKRRLTVFAGVSGSGKSSLVFDTIAAESQRVINETYSSFVQGFMPSMSRPDVVGLEGVTAAIVASIRDALANFTAIGLGCIALDRPSSTLSGGEAQRVKMIRHLGSVLSDVTYFFDEPTTGLHLTDTARLVDLFDRLVDSGATVIVVEHNLALVARADYVTTWDRGRLCGRAGGDGGYGAKARRYA